MSEAIKMIAARLKSLREIQGISDVEIASYLNVPIAVYRNYEEGKLDIPAGVLFEIAPKLGVEMSELLTGDKPKLHMYSVVRKGKGVGVNRRNDYKYSGLAYNFTQKKAEPFIVTIDPQPEEYVPEFNFHPGQEFIYLLDGHIKFFIADKEVLLEQGDSVYFDPTNPHTFLALDNQPARMLVILV